MRREKHQSEAAKKDTADWRRGRMRRGRSNGHGTLERKPNGVYIARWVANGKRFAKSTGTSDRREAEKVLEELTAPYRLGGERRTLEAVTARLEGVTAEIREWREALPALAVVHAWDAYEASATRPDTGSATLGHYCAHFSALARWLEANRPNVRELRQIGRAEAEAFAADLRDRWSAGTYNKHIVFFRHMWRTLIDDDEAKDPMAKDPRRLPAKLSVNPWERVKKREGAAHTRRELTVEELARVVADLTGEMRLLFALGIYTGLRLGDCALLDWGAVDLVRGFVSLVPRKTARRSHGRPVVIPLHDVLAGMLAEIPPERRAGYVLPETAAMYGRDSSALVKRIQKHFATCGIRTVSRGADGRARVDVGFHSLRHTFVSLSANAGVPLVVVQAMVGHSSPAMTRHYVHESEAALKSAVAALPNVAGAPTIAVEATRNAVEREEGAGDMRMPPVACDDPRPLLVRFRAMWLEMSAQERKAARRWMRETDVNENKTQEEAKQ